ncbi:membrane protein insertion efficiency factor YidD [bacterium]|nr:membrane protein insertion efficiency factor YidD [bacterium]
MKKLSIKFIEAYQKHLSPDHSKYFKHMHPHGYCRYYPTCSEYTKLAIKKY